MTIEQALLIAWRCAAIPELEEQWRTLWPLIFRIETAHQNDDVDGHAEDELVAHATRLERLPCLR